MQIELAIAAGSNRQTFDRNSTQIRQNFEKPIPVTPRKQISENRLFLETSCVAEEERDTESRLGRNRNGQMNQFSSNPLDGFVGRTECAVSTLSRDVFPSDEFPRVIRK